MDTAWSLGQWIQRRRRALGLTQHELAARAICSAELISKIEADTRRPSRQVAALLADGLSLPQTTRDTFVRCARAESSVDRLPSPVSDLPGDTVAGRSAVPRSAAHTSLQHVPVQLTSFVGRGTDRQALGAILGQPSGRLLTLIGPGGVGKTRLALQVMSDLSDQFDDGVAWVDLSPVLSPALVPETIAQVVGAKTLPGHSLIGTLSRHLQSRQLLLVLDNLEHLLPATPLITELLAAAPRLIVLATSRIVLNLSGEHVYEVPPLPVPVQQNTALNDPTGDAIVERLMTYPSIRLFVERATAAQPGFMLTPANAVTIAQLCTRLEGLPLAIELAATRARLLDPEAILAALGNRLDLLNHGPRDRPARQQGLRNTIDWSHTLLSAGEQLLFARLSVFAGGWTLDAAGAVCCSDTSGRPGAPMLVLDVLQTLFESSLISRSIAVPGTARRYTMLETIREYAYDQLKRRGEEVALLRRHAEYYLALAERDAPRLHSGDPQPWLLLDAEHENIRAALVRTSDGDHEQSDPSSTTVINLRLAAAMWYYWFRRGHFTDAQRWLEPMERRAGDISPAIRAGALTGATFIAAFTGAHQRTRHLASEALIWARRTEDARLIALALTLATMWDPGISSTDPGLEEAARLAYDGDDRWLQAFVLGHLAWAKAGAISGDLSATELAATALERARAAADPWLIARILWISGNVAWQSGDYLSARIFSEEALHIWRTLDDRLGVAYALVTLAEVARNDGDYAAAIEFQRERLALEQGMGNELGIASALSFLGDLAAEQGNFVEATTLNTESQQRYLANGESAWAAAICLSLARISLAQGSYDVATRLASTLTAEAHELGERLLELSAQSVFAEIRLAQGDAATAVEHFAACLAQERANGNRSRIALALCRLGDATAQLGSFEAARQLLDESLLMCRSLGSSWHSATVYVSMGRALLAAGLYLDATAHLLESLRYFARFGARPRIAELLDDFGRLALLREHDRHAACLWGAAETVRRQMGAVRHSVDEAGRQDDIALARRRLGDSAFEAAFAEGQSMSLDQAIDAAIDIAG